MREYTSEPMNPGRILIIRNIFPMLPCVFLLLVLIKSENTKSIFTFCNYTENPNNTFTLKYLFYFTFC
jgi:hypothetical protein